MRERHSAIQTRIHLELPQYLELISLRVIHYRLTLNPSRCAKSVKNDINQRSIVKRIVEGIYWLLNE
jgi:hypothetical protein